MSPTPTAVPVPTIAQRVKALRQRKGWSAEELGNALKAKGVKWDRFTVANLENGKRQNVTVVELLALALVLDVAPVNLLVPLDSEPYQVTPDGTEAQNSADVWLWMRGQCPLPGTSKAGERIYFTEAPTEAGRGERDAATGLYEWYEKIDSGSGSGEHREAP